MALGLAAGASSAAIKIGKHHGVCPPSVNDGLVACLLILAYVLYHARRMPERLDEWGFTTPLTRGAILSACGLLAFALAVIVAWAKHLGLSTAITPQYPFEMLDYLIGAFPQQFFMCSVGLVTLARIPRLKGQWRIPLLVGCIFALAHLWTPARFSPLHIPVQSVITFPLGFVAAAYFLSYRTIIPLTIIHAILFPLYFHWVEAHL